MFPFELPAIGSIFSKIVETADSLLIDLFVLGRVPGTNFSIDFYHCLLIILVLVSLTVLIRDKYKKEMYSFIIQLERYSRSSRHIKPLELPIAVPKELQIEFDSEFLAINHLNPGNPGYDNSQEVSLVDAAMASSAEAEDLQAA